MHYFNSGLFSLLGVALLSVSAQAQLVPDSTLGNEASIVTPNTEVRGLPADLIQGGAVRGSDLYHSFSDFNVGDLQRVYFANPTGIETILTRVTGSNPSMVLGTLGVDGAASLFLLNPNGILFGANARLDIAGSFTASTAYAFLFPDGSQFSATSPQASPLLTISITPGLQHGSADPEAWLTNRANLAVGAGQTLTLHGGTVINSGILTAASGTVQLLGNQVGLFDQAVVDVSSPTGGGTVLIGGDFQGKGTVPNASRTYVSPDAVINADTTATGNGGRVIVWADDATRFYGTITARGGSFPSSVLVPPPSNGGFVEVSGKNFMDFQGKVDTSAPFGQTGTLLLDPTNITIVAGFNTPAQLAANDQFADPGVNNTIANGTINAAAANVILQATNDITVNAAINIFAAGVGFTAQAGNNITVNSPITTNGGDIQLIANDASSGAASGTGAITINNAELRSQGGNMLLRAAGDISLNAVAGTVTILTEDQFGGNVGNLTVETNSTLRIQATGTTNFAQIGTGTFGAGNAGDVTIAADRVEINRSTNSITGALTGIFSRSQGSGDAGNITITTNQLVLTNGGGISAETLGSGDAGNVTITTNQLLADNNSRIGANTLGAGNAGSIDITTNQLIASNGTQIGAGTFGTGNVGAVIVRASDLELLGTALNGSPSGIFAPNTPGSTGDSGQVEITTDRLILRDGGRVSVATNNSRNGGNLTIQATDIELSGVSPNGSPSRLETRANINATGNAGNLTIATARLLVQDGAQVNTSSLLSNGGNQTIRATDGVRVLNGGTLTSLSLAGDGGAISLTVGQLQMQQNSAITTTSLLDDGGDLTIQATGAVNVATNSLLNTQTDAGTSGNLQLTASTLTVQDNSQVTTGTLAGKAGNLQIQTTGAVTVLTTSGLNANADSGSGGAIQITAPTLTLQTNSQVDNSSVTGNAGNLIQVTTTDIVSIVDNSKLTAIGFNGGTINLETGQLRVQTSSFIAANNIGSATNTVPGKAGDVAIRATGNALIADASAIFTNAEQGAGGNLQLESQNLTLQNGSAIAASTFFQGRAGNVTVRSSDSILVQQDSTLGTLSTGATAGGNLAVTATTLTVDGANVTTSIIGSGDAGNLSVNVRNLAVRNIGAIGTTVLGQGTSGTLSIQAETIAVSDFGSLSTSAVGSGSGGTFAIATNTLTILNQGTVNTVSLDIASLDLASSSFPGLASLLTSSPLAASLVQAARDAAVNAPQGNAGELTIQARDAITIADGGQLSTAARGNTNGGHLTVQTSDLSANDGQIISTIVGQGRGGDITVQADNLLLTNQGEISSRGEQQGAAANITLNLANNFNARDGQITATSTQAGGGTINIQATDIRLRGSSLVSTSVFDSTGGGGNITLNSTIFLALEDSDILANAERGPGGDITINSPGFLANLFTQAAATPVGRNPGSFGQFRGNGRVDISADSAAGRSGTINLPNVDPSRGLVPLPDGLGDVSNQIAQACKPGQRATGSFVNIGRGGIPETPYDSRGTDEVWEDLGGVRGAESGVRSLGDGVMGSEGDGVGRQEEVGVRIVKCGVEDEQ